MTRYFTQKLSIDEIADKLVSSLKRKEDFQDWFCDNYDLETMPSDLKEYPLKDVCCTYLTCDIQQFSSRVEKDLSKVAFGSENVYADPKNYGGGSDALLGFQTTSTGLSYLGVLAGNDSDTDLFLILYHDGAEVRAYIPKDGNTWNTDINASYGFSEYDHPNYTLPSGISAYDPRMNELSAASDVANIKKRQIKKDELGRPIIDWVAINNDIERHILYKPSK